MSQQPLFAPHSNWSPPTTLPDLSRAKLLAIDTETKDPGLLSKGPGFLRGEADVRGFSVATDNASWFFPLFYPEDNYHDPDAAIAWLRDVCKQECDKVFHNAMYDIEALWSAGIEVKGRWHDTMVYEALLEESKSVSLNATANRRVGATKDEALLIEAAAAWSVDPKSEMYLLPARYVGHYGAQDAALLPSILQAQTKLIGAYGMSSVLDLESRLLPATWDMRKTGVRVDVEHAHELDKQWRGVVRQRIEEIHRHVPFDVDIWKSKSLVHLCEHLKIKYMRTAAGNPSFTNDWFIGHPHPVMELIAEARKYDKMCRDFLHGQILEYEVNGRIHGQFLTTRRDDGGTRSGRFASSNPNLQQVPARDPTFGPAIRGLYIPDEGARWGKFDYSSQEPRITLHLAHLAGIQSATPFVERYKQDPKFCQHSYAAQVLDIERATCKDINLGLTYGMGVPKLSYKLGVDIDTAAHYRGEYKRAMPFVGEVADHYTAMAEEKGYTETILGRRSYFKGADEAFCYKALNRSVQGSGADLMKTAIVLVYEELGVPPLLTVHDETDYNIYEEEHAWEISGIMEHAIEMTVPQVVEPELGPSWGNCK